MSKTVTKVGLLFKVNQKNAKKVINSGQKQ